MKNKGFTFILFIVVGIVWYRVFFRIKENLIDKDANMQIVKYQPQRIKFHKDTFQLSANYRDPFHSKSLSVETEDYSLSNSSSHPVIYQPPPQSPPPPKIHKWPKMKYYGVMKSNPQKGNLAILVIDNMLFNLREGEFSNDGIVLKKIYGDSILIVQDKYSKIIKK